MDYGSGSVEEAIDTIRAEAAELAHVLDMQGLVALLARCVHRQYILETVMHKSKLPCFTEDQVYAMIMTGRCQLDALELNGSPPSTDGDTVGPSPPVKRRT
jgi:hypothetical protein